MAAGWKLGHPQFSARFRGECTKPVGIRCAYKNHSARSCNAAAKILRSALQTNFTQLSERLIDAECGRPRNLAFVDVDGDKSAIRRRIARHCGSTRQPIGERSRSAIGAARTVRVTLTARLRYSELSTSGRKRRRSKRTSVVNIDENQPELRVVRWRSPVRTSQRRWKCHDRRLAERPRVRTARLQIVPVPEIRAVFLDLRRHFVDVIARHPDTCDRARL